jgi:hypothetical protein
MIEWPKERRIHQPVIDILSSLGRGIFSIAVTTETFALAQGPPLFQAAEGRPMPFFGAVILRTTTRHHRPKDLAAWRVVRRKS